MAWVFGTIAEGVVGGVLLGLIAADRGRGSNDDFRMTGR
jgi:hypothetical protein